MIDHVFPWDSDVFFQSTRRGCPGLHKTKLLPDELSIGDQQLLAGWWFGTGWWKQPAGKRSKGVMRDDVGWLPLFICKSLAATEGIWLPGDQRSAKWFEVPCCEPKPLQESAKGRASASWPNYGRSDGQILIIPDYLNIFWTSGMAKIICRDPALRLWTLLFMSTLTRTCQRTRRCYGGGQCIYSSKTWYTNSVRFHYTWRCLTVAWLLFSPFFWGISSCIWTSSKAKEAWLH